ncbi:ABC transporter permease [Vibrio breoganii]|uniref:ABC transporter permease n=1 Tax=Vibrio breoganii TaxID=553239 RepID=UPI000C854148|nr:ABC transporter permease [Vibrio breoganii]PMG36597.1 multidrug ABC transporter permease [Vibrio breoganii]PMG93483.1 multidrug ABC transporter permease [Vibrio breoganii]PMJ45861.1 multidrug ABC transporter permease [Vibrio breoganii]PMK60268.1 multidrug ABC transporter permease [Vibrio breoganii]PML42197.1 multidrug ABC transporter permease [Vibrio breoganii]
MFGFIATEWQRLRRDKWLFASITWMPVLVAISVWWIFSQGIARSLPIAIVDHQQSVISQQLVRYLDASDTLKVSTHFQSEYEAKKALSGSDIYAYVVIPRDFDRDIYLSNPPQVSVFYNSQYILVGKLVNSAVLRSVGTFDAQIETLKNLSAGGATVKSALGKAVNVRTQITPLFNLNSNYAQFLVSAIIPAIWQIVIVVGTILTLAMHKREGLLQQWPEQGVLACMAKTLSCYIPLYLALGVGYLLWFYALLDWPMQGGYMVLIAAQLATVIACMLVGCVFFFITYDAARALSFAGAFTAPGFAFMGITFPVTDMTTLAQFWRSLLPISHYIEAQISQVSYGASSMQTLHYLVPMLGYLLLIFVLMKLAPKKIQEAEA